MARTKKASGSVTLSYGERRVVKSSGDVRFTLQSEGLTKWGDADRMVAAIPMGDGELRYPPARNVYVDPKGIDGVAGFRLTLTVEAIRSPKGTKAAASPEGMEITPELIAKIAAAMAAVQ